MARPILTNARDFERIRLSTERSQMVSFLATSRFVRRDSLCRVAVTSTVLFMGLLEP